jgi:hypothetical protein
LRITPESDLPEVALAVAGALRKAGIRAVLTGGACAAIHTAGGYSSEDVDFILQSAPSLQSLDGAMASLGFRRRNDQYFHPQTTFFVEFPAGPLGIGRDLAVKPVFKRIRASRATVRTLSATDSCRDRLAAFYHWTDRQSLDVAVLIALRNRVDMSKISRWSAREGATEGYRQFVRELARARGRSRTGVRRRNIGNGRRHLEPDPGRR